MVGRHHVGHMLAAKTQAGVDPKQTTRGVLPGTQGGLQHIDLAKNIGALGQVTFTFST